LLLPQGCPRFADVIEKSMPYLPEYKVLPKKNLLLKVAVGFTLALLASLFFDQRVAQFFRQKDMEQVWLSARNITNVGLSIHYFVASILLYVIARWVKRGWMSARALARDLFFSLLGSGLFLHIVKSLIGRQRPHISPDSAAHVFHPFTFNWDFQSLPSGHSQVMFTVATVLSFYMPRGRWIFYLIATFFALTRVVTYDHFLGDVIAGATVGHVGASLTLHAIYRWQNRKPVARPNHV
jgi:membrane-associated phospholipid phosphatase